MTLRQVIAALVCVLLTAQWTHAVVNTAKPATPSESSASNSATKNSGSNAPSDSVAASSETETNRREIPAGGLSDSYGVPIPSNSYGPPPDSYLSQVSGNIGLPAPVYGVPNGPTNNIVYPAPPPDIPPPFPSISGTYGPPKPVYGPPLKLHLPTHHKPHFQKPFFGTSFHHNSFKSPRPTYGPPPPIFVPKPQYGPPIKPTYGPPKLPKPVYGPPLKYNFGPPKPLFISSKPVHGPIKVTKQFGAPLPTYGPPHTVPLFTPTNGPLFNTQVGPIFNPPKNIYGPPKDLHVHGPPAPVYGPPDPVPHGPPHPGVPAPPTPPDIKYDGWQPIPGLVSRPPSGAYGVPHHGGQIQGGLDGIAPPPLHSELALTYASSFAHGTGGGFKHNGPSDSYGAPLNTVTGSGGVVSSSGNDHVSFGHGSHGGNNFGGQDNSLSVIKSIGYEIFPSGSGGGNLGGGNLGGGNFGGGNFDGLNSGAHISSGPIDSYGAPPADSYDLNGPYPAAKHQGGNSNAPSFSALVGGSSHGSHGSGIGLIPPSGVYGVPPGGQYGAPLLSPPKNFHAPSGSYGAPNALNALEINPPKSPVKFREPVPSGLLESIGESVAHKDAHGIEHSHSSFQGQAYIPPPVPDLTKQKNIGDGHGSISAPTGLYSLPNPGSPVSFQTVVQGPNSHSNGNDFGGSFNFLNDQGHGSTLTSYTAPLGAIDSSYGIPLQPQALTANFDQSQSFDFSSFNNFGNAFTSTYSVPQISLQSTLPLPHDCSQHKSQPFLQTGYGLPSGSASSYSASISSLNTNIGSQTNYPLPSFSFGNSDLQGVHSLSNSVHSDIPPNSIEAHGKSLGHEYFGKDANLQQSHEIHFPNGVQNIPVQGALGSYTLQIQSADGLTGHQGSVENVPHEQVLSEGLLQSILAAIEQPQQQHQQQQYNNGYGDLQNSPSGSVVSYQQNSQIADGEAQHSVTRQVVVNAPNSDQGSTTPKSVEATTSHPVSEAEQSIHLIDNNEIALYFNNNEPQDGRQQVDAAQTAGDSNDQKTKDQASKEVRNGQQYGSFVSFKGPHSNYVYGELKSAKNETQSATPTSDSTQ